MTGLHFLLLDLAQATEFCPRLSDWLCECGWRGLSPDEKHHYVATRWGGAYPRGLDARDFDARDVPHTLSVEADSDTKGNCWWRARCRCGWASDWRSRQHVAEDDFSTHVGVA